MNVNKIQRLYTKRASLYHFLFVDFLKYGSKVEKFLRCSEYVQPHFKILDAGCGTGNATKALYAIAREKKYEDVKFHAFDLTQVMLDLFRQWIDKVDAPNIILYRADVLNLGQLPSDWNEYNTIVSSAMLEYLPKDKIHQALSNLRKLLKRDGKFIAFITRRNIITKLFIEWWWQANTYNEKEIKQVLFDAGFSEFKITPWFWNSMFVIEARR